MLIVIGIVGLIVYAIAMVSLTVMFFLNMPRQIAPSFEVNLSGRGLLWGGLSADRHREGLSTGVGLVRGCGGVQARR